MTNLALTYPYLAERLVPGGLLRGFSLVIGFSLFTVVLAQISIPLPWTPVPITGQTLAVLLTGAVLGPRLGFVTLVCYLAEGAVGLPVFAGGTGGFGKIFGPTGGYLIAFPLAAGLVGWLATRGWDRSPLWMAFAMAAGSAVIYALGVSWLGTWLALSGKFPGPLQLLNMGMFPFLPGDAIKAGVAMVLLPTAWQLVKGRDRSNKEARGD